jgi:cathepsin B
MGTWTATTNNKFTGLSIQELRQFTGTLGVKSGSGNNNAQNSQFPNFDARTQWPDAIHPIRDQGQCGSCWAFGATESFSDRVAVATGDKIDFVFSPEDLVSCDAENYGCGGGYLQAAWDYITNVGLVTESCFPYDAESGNAGPCENTCSDSETWTPYKSINVQSFGIPDGQTEIATNGPIETAFDVYEDFFSYTGGIYVQNSQEYVGGHAVKVLGYGYDEATGLNYWLAANSWGTSWGDNGFFKIAAGQCGFDSNFIAGQFDQSSGKASLF